MTCFIDFQPMKGNHAGNKARIDVSDICKKANLKCVEKIEEEKFNTFFDKIKYVITPGNINKLVNIMFKKKGITLLQYPFYFNPLMRFALKKYIKHNKTILLIHDVDSLRNFGKDKVEDEVALFNTTSAIIVHNRRMKNKLTDIGVQVPMIELGIFDYLLDELPINIGVENDVAFAGNLSKSVFLNEIKKAGVGINLYGPGYNENMNGECVTYKGCYPPNKVPYVLNAKFGLIWDGDSLETCSGNTGEYLKYNNPHKLSLYIAAGLPVIVWKESAIAEFVLTNNIGIDVDSVYEIKDKIKGISSNEYEKMKASVLSMQKRICKGRYTTLAIKKAISMLK